MNQPVITYESIKRQSDDFFNELTQHIKRFRAKGDLTTEGIKKSHIMQVIKQYTGLSILLYIERGFNARIFLPYLTPNHVFGGGSIAATKILDVKKTTIQGTIDIENARVSGCFADVTSELMVGMDLLKPGALTDDELAAVILHELGHAFTCWQFMSTMAYGALVIQQTINNVFMTDNYQTKTVSIKAAEEVLGIESGQEIEDMVDTSRENLEVILNTRFIRQLRSRTKSAYYDVRNCEQLADTFAVRHGAGNSLARATHKMNSAFGMYGPPSPFVNLLVQTGAVLKILTPFSGVSLANILYTLDQPKRYDDPKDRLAFIKFQLIDDLKQIPSGNKKLRTAMLESIDEISKLMSTIVERRHIFTAIHASFTRSGRAISNQEADIKKLEGMLYNDLFLQSAKLKNLH